MAGRYSGHCVAVGHRPTLKCSGNTNIPVQDERLVSRMALAISKGEEPTAREIRQGCGLDNVSLRTVQRRLVRSPKLKNRMKVKKPFISPMDRIRRVEWCEEPKQRPLKRWRRVIWSDESPFVFRFSRKSRVWILSRSPFDLRQFTGTVKHDKKIMVWGYFNNYGVGKSVKINGIMEKKQYKRILQQNLQASARTLYPNGG
jgi:hypothetical protein